jgi:UDP-N-acetylglucosamine 2-epimerase (non-hydrolysing)
MKLLLIAGARPNFMKIAPLFRACPSSVQCKIIHTGQHYDENMSGVFFADLNIPLPDYHLETGSGSHAEQTAKIMVEFERVCLIERPDIVMVVGDVNSTLACAITAKKLHIKVAHVEAGLRSGDMDMPEEINRIVTDSISDYLFVTELSGVQNLRKEGKVGKLVGDVMVDNLFFQNAQLNGDKPRVEYPYIFATLHRPSNVDNPQAFKGIVEAMNEIAEDTRILFPMHPRTRDRANKFRIDFSDRITLFPPLGYKESLYLWRSSKAVLTDSGGMQIETTALGVPCVTIRDSTERPMTIELGTNVLAGTKKDGIMRAYEVALQKRGQIPDIFDGKASERIWRILKTQ